MLGPRPNVPEALIRWDTTIERDYLACACRDSLWAFVQVAYGGLWNPRITRWLDPEVNKPMCDWFEHHARAWLSDRALGLTRQHHLMMIVPREFGKTTLITCAGQLWLHLHDPELSTFTGSETVARACEILGSIRAVMSGEDAWARFTWLYGNWRDRSRKWSAQEVEHAVRRARARRDASLSTWGIEKTLTGTHPDALFLDDPTSYEALDADAGWLDRVNAHIDGLAPVLSADGLLVLVGTRYHDNDHFGRLLRVEGARSRRSLTRPPESPPFTAYDSAGGAGGAGGTGGGGGEPVSDEYGEPQVRDDGVWDVFFARGRRDDGTPVFPRQWPEARLRDYERKNSVHYAAQIMNNPLVAGTTPLREADIEPLYVEPLEVPGNLRFSVHCDTAFKVAYARGAAPCDSVIEVWGHEPRTGLVYYIEGYGSARWRADDFLDKLVWVMQRLRAGRTHFPEIAGTWPFVVTDEQEPHSKQGSWEIGVEAWFKQRKTPPPPLVMLPRTRTDKTQRLVVAASHWKDKRVRLVRGAPGLPTLIWQMTRIGVSSLCDWADAAADVFHPQCYSAPLLVPDSAPRLVRADPWDGILKQYDAYHGRQEHPYEPV